MDNSKYKYVIDSLFNLVKFIWQKRHENKNLRAFKIYAKIFSSLTILTICTFIVDSTKFWYFKISARNIGIYEIIAIVIISIVFFIILIHINKAPFEKQEKSRLKKIEDEQFLQSINPIKTFADFNIFYDTHNVNKYVDTPKLKSMRETIVNKDNGHIRLLGLSGTGKTFLIQTAFNNTSNISTVFYCDSKHSDLRSSIETLCKKYPDCTLILDNCPNKICADIISSFGSKIRIISSYFDPNDYNPEYSYKILQ